MGHAITRISTSVIHDLLQLPEEYHIVGLWFDPMQAVLMIGVASALIEEVPPLTSSPEMSLTYRLIDEGDGSRIVTLSNLEVTYPERPRDGKESGDFVQASYPINRSRAPTTPDKTDKTDRRSKGRHAQMMSITPTTPDKTDKTDRRDYIGQWINGVLVTPEDGRAFDLEKYVKKITDEKGG